MKTSQIGLKLIEEYEGLILGAYDDFNDKIVKPGDTVRGTLTIGYGHTTSAGLPRVVAGQRITQSEADKILASDLAKVETEVTNLVKVKLNQNQFDALVSFQFNTGALGKSSALRKLNAGDYAGCANALCLYNRGNGQVLQGLVKRREAEKALFMKPYTPPPGAGTAAVGGLAVGAILTGHPYVVGAGCIAILLLGWYVIHKLRKHKDVV